MKGGSESMRKPSSWCRNEFVCKVHACRQVSVTTGNKDRQTDTLYEDI